MYIVDYSTRELSESSHNFRTGQGTAEWHIRKLAYEMGLNGCHCDRAGVGSVLHEFLFRVKDGKKAAIKGKILACENLPAEQFVKNILGGVEFWLLSQRGNLEVRMEQEDPDKKYYWTLSLEFTPKSE